MSTHPSRHPSNYLKVAVGKLRDTSGDRFADGQELVRQCLERLDQTKFPPRLFILLATPAFADYQQLLEGIHAARKDVTIPGSTFTMASVPLIGTSAAAVWFTEDDITDVHERGAALICLASDHIAAEAAISEDAANEPRQAVDKLLTDLRPEQDVEINARGNRVLFTFVPGHAADLDPAKYRAREIIEAINLSTVGRLPVFGGASAAGLNPGAGTQFFGNRTYQGAIVGALVTLELAYGIGLNHGAKFTNEKVRLRVDPKTHAVQSIELDGQKQSGAELRAYLDTRAKKGRPLVFGQRAASGLGHRFVVPRIDGNHVKLNCEVTEGLELRVVEPSAKSLTESVKELEEWAMKQFRIEAEQVAVVLGMGCVSRYRHREAMDFKVRTALTSAQRRFPNSEFVGCYLDGEIGSDRIGGTVFGNWSLSELFLADDVPIPNSLQLAIDAFPIYLQRAAHAQGVDQAIRVALEYLQEAKFAGGMVSLVYQDRDQQWIKGRKAIGPRWEGLVLEATCRRLNGNDILAIAAKVDDLQFVDNAELDPRCDKWTAKLGGVTSFCAMCLKDEQGEVIGVLQVDLSDKRGRTKSNTMRLLRTVHAFTQAVLTNAIVTEELRLVREMDRLAEQSLTMTKVNQAVEAFLLGCCHILNADGHVRRLTIDRKVLELVCGVGRYFDLAKNVRSRVSIEDLTSISALVFRNEKDVCVQDTASDPQAQSVLTTFEVGAPILEALDEHKSFATFFIPNEHRISMVASIASHSAFYFDALTMRVLRKMVIRLGQIVAYVSQRESREQDIRLLELRHNITPPIWDRDRPIQALRDYIVQFGKAWNADVTSCYLWCPTQKRYVLRAESGWFRGEWLDAAWIESGDGIAGKAIAEGQPKYEADRFRPELAKTIPKYLGDMFKFPLSRGQGDTYEFLVFPLRAEAEVNPQLGLITLYRQKRRSDATGFVTLDANFLAETGRLLSTLVFAIQEAAERCQSEAAAAQRDRVIDELKRLADPLQRRSLADIANGVSAKIAEVYDAVECKIWINGNGPLGYDSFGCVMAASQAQLLFDDRFVKQVWKSGKTFPFPYRLSVDPRNPDCVRRELHWERVYLPLADVTGHCLGVLAIRHNDRQPHPFSVPFLQSMATELALVIQSHKAQEAKQQATATIEGMSRFISIGFHGIKNHLTSICAGLALINEERHHLSNEYQSFLDVCRERAGALSIQFEQAKHRGRLLYKNHDGQQNQICSVASLLDKVIIEIRKRPDTKARISFINESFEGRDLFLIDADQIIECFRNLITNAVRIAGLDGKVDVFVKVDPTETICEVSIEDSGPGFLQSTFDAYISGKFESLQPTGSGVGLFLSRLYCDANNARLSLKSQGPKDPTKKSSKTTVAVAFQRTRS